MTCPSVTHFHTVTICVGRPRPSAVPRVILSKVLYPSPVEDGADEAV
jgi:hypothetical protein